jgi:hypothetical protein
MFSDPNNKAFSVRPPSLDQFRLSSIAVFVPAMPVRAVVLNSEYVANLQRKDHINPKPFTSNVSLHVEFAIAKHIIKQSEDLALNFGACPVPGQCTVTLPTTGLISTRRSRPSRLHGRKGIHSH